MQMTGGLEEGRLTESFLFLVPCVSGIYVAWHCPLSELKCMV